MVRRQAGNLLATLASAIGQESAQIELRWMKQALSPRLAEKSAPGTLLSRPSLAKMVERRVKGEPLQYILGETGPVLIVLSSVKFIPQDLNPLDLSISSHAHQFLFLAQRLKTGQSELLNRSLPPLSNP
jgi:methylase of polypeptide subunit release factors